jgi:hypothetical protein
MSNGKLILALGLAAGIALAAVGQTPPATPAPAQTTTQTTTAAPPAEKVPDGGMPQWLKPETPAQRTARIGTAEDPGNDPDENKRFWRFGLKVYIQKTEKRFSNFEGCEEGSIRPIGYMNVCREIYQMNDKFIWAWVVEREPSEAPAAPDTASPYTKEQLDYWQFMRPEFSPLDVPSADTTIHFEESSDGLPSAGSWRNSLAVADMNGDGFLDIIAPPERGMANGLPAIFLGDGKGHWTYWKDVRWPQALDYGSVVAADVNKDGHMDLVFGVHLTGIYVFLGDGKGNFKVDDEGLPNDFPTRRVIVADVDHDGWPDIVAQSEGPTPRNDRNPEYGKLRVYYSREKGTRWEGANISEPNEDFGGDFLSTGKFNDDVYPDFIGSSVYFNGPHIMFLSKGPKKYENVGGSGALIPGLSFYYANATGRFSSKTLDDALISFVHIWPDVDPKLIPAPARTRVSGIDRISFTGKAPKRTSIVRWPSDRGVWGMAAADVDGDGNLDIVYTRQDNNTINILLGDGKGGFRRATTEGIKLERNGSYDVKVVDVNGDGKPDVILAYESSGTTSLSQRDGSIHVFLNRGATPTTKPPATAGAKQ